MMLQKDVEDMKYRTIRLMDRAAEVVMTIAAIGFAWVIFASLGQV